MTISNKSPIACVRLKANVSTRRGFTLVEMMVALVVFSIMMASLLPTFVFFSKSVVGLGNYADMSVDSRMTLEYFSRDIHTAKSLTVASTDEVEIVLPVDAGGFTINYTYDSAAGTFTRKQYDSGGSLLDTNVLFSDVSNFHFLYYNRLNVELAVGSSAPLLTETKSVQLDATLVKKVINQENTDYIISARFLMRNL